MQNWIKHGCVFGEKNERFESFRFAAVPIVQCLIDNYIKVFFSARDINQRAFIGWVVINVDDTSKIVDSGKISVENGATGFFDEDGIMPCSLLTVGGELWMYYIGWNRSMSVPFRNSIGLLVSRDNGETFKKYSRGPILDRSIFDPCFVASCDVKIDKGKFKMWYLSCVDWVKSENGLIHKYHIKYAESNDGVEWKREGLIAIDFKNKFEYAISVPRVRIYNDEYHMWYSYRASKRVKGYRIGYATSPDGINWIRKDDEINLNTSPKGWDSEMICYPFIFEQKGNKFMLYNGNGYGKTGFGLAELKLN